MEQQLAISDVIYTLNNKEPPFIPPQAGGIRGGRLLNQARNKLAIGLNDANPLRVLDHFNTDNRVRILEELLVAAPIRSGLKATFKDLITEQNQKGFSVIACFRQ